MNKIMFNNVAHRERWDSPGEERYLVDWNTQDDQKYKVPIHGVRVYEDNSITVTTNGHHDPGWRASLKQRLGIEFTLISDMIGYTLHDPATGAKIPKRLVEQDAYHFDRGRMRLYKTHYTQGWRLYWKSWDAEPEGGRPMVYHLPNKPRAVALRKQLRPYIDLGTTLNQLKASTTPYYGSNSVLYQVQAFLAKPKNYRDLKDKYVQSFARVIAWNTVHFANAVAEATRDKFENNYLIVKEK